MKKLIYKAKTIRRFSIAILLMLFHAVLILSSCATICVPILGQQKEVPALTINADVPNADVYINGKYVGQTPYSHFGDGKKCDAKKIMVKKEGYKSQTIKPRKLSGWAYLNFIEPTTFIGFIVDRHNPKCWSYKHEVYYFELEEKKK